MAQLVHSGPQVMIVPTAATPSGKDSRWLTLEVCREFQRSKCSRSDTECKFAHPPPHVEVQNGRVVACFDSIKGKCQRKDPPCKYLHPPQHLREQLLQNGRNNLILKNLQLQTYQSPYTNMMPVAYEAGGKPVAVSTVVPGQYTYLTHYPGLQALSAVPAQAPTATYSTYLPPFASVAMPAGADPTSVMSQQLPPSMITKAVRADKFETSTDVSEAVTSHASLMDSFNYPTYITQATSSATMPHPMLIGKKRMRDPADDFLLQSTGMVPTYKRIAISDLSKGGYPVYQTNPLMSPLQPTSLMQLQQQPSYIPVSYTAYVYPSDATLTTPAAAPPLPPHHLSAVLAPTLVPPPSTLTPPGTSISVGTASTSLAVPTTNSSGDNSLASPSGLSLYMISKSNHSNNTTTTTQGATRVPSIPNNAYYVEYFGNNKQLRDTLQVCQEFRSGLCNSPYCKLVHLSEDYVEVNNNQVTVCRDFATRQTCRRSRCKYYHIPIDLPPS